MIIAEILLISDSQYSIKIGSENYFSFTVAGVIGLIFLFLLFGIKFSYWVGFKEENISMGKGITKPLNNDETFAKRQLQ